MKDYIVGGKDCSINKIVIVMDKSNHSRHLVEDWRKLARALDTPNERIYEREQDLLMKRQNTLDVVTDLLFDWRSRLAEEAKFECLLDILEYQCGWKAISDELWKAFQTCLTENITWTQLDMRSRNKIIQSQIEFQGQLKTLKDIFSIFNEMEAEQMIQRALSGSTILKLLRGEHVALLNETIPETPFYVQRVLTGRRCIKPEIFQNDCPDIFVIEGISLRELSKIAGNEYIAKSSNQREKLTSRFILLDFKDGFEMVTKACKYEPVHHLCYKNGHIHWVKSCGSISLIQEYLHGDQYSIPEQDFLTVLQNEFNKNLPVCIADIPGMGKTCLVVNLARQRLRHADDKTLVLFISLSKFLDETDNISEQNVCEENVCLWISKFVSQNELGRETVSKMLCSKFHRVEIFFDGYDELAGDKQKFTTNLIKCLVHDFKHVHMAITTRVHKRQQLEQKLMILSYDIKSYDEVDQVNFLEQIWSKKYGAQCNNDLHRFANFTANKIRMTLPSTDCDVVGIPLQCNMFAEIFANDALRYTNDPSLPLELSLDINSVNDMYSALMAHRLEKCTGEELMNVKKILALTALHAVLPGNPCAFVANEIFAQTNDFTKINSLGILIVDRNCNGIKFQFLHHSYAEYILANFLVDDLVNKGQIFEKLFGFVETEDLLLDAVSLSADDPDVRIGTMECSTNDLWKRIFKSNRAEQLRANWETLADKLNMSNFHRTEIKGNLNLNLSLGMSDRYKDPLYLVLSHWRKCFQDQPKLSQLLDALRSLNFSDLAENLKLAYSDPIFKNKNLCFFIDKSLNRQQLECNLKLLKHTNRNHLFRLKDILSACAYHNFCNLFVSLSQHCLSIQKKHPSVSTGIEWSSMIFVAVKCSSLNLVTECCKFVESIQNCKLNEMQFKSRRSSVYTPLHEAAERGDFTIFDYIFKKFGPCALKMNYLMHSCTAYSLTNSGQVIREKMQIIQLLTDTSKDFLNEAGSLLPTPILMWNVHLKLLEYIINLGADIFAVDDEGRNAAHRAARYLSPSDFHTFVDFLLKREAKEMFCMRMKSNQFSPIGVAAQFIDLKPETIEMLSARLENASLKSTGGVMDDGLYCAIVGQRKRSVLKMFVECGADPMRLWKDNRTAVHVTAEVGNVEAIKYLVSLGCSINAQDAEGRTPLHLAFLFGQRNLDGTVRALLEHNVRADIKDVYGYKAIWYAEREDKLWMLEPCTKDLLVKESQEKPIWTKLWPLVKFISYNMFVISKLYLRSCIIEYFI